jgi:hypothetical protein
MGHEQIVLSLCAQLSLPPGVAIIIAETIVCDRKLSLFLNCCRYS